WKVLEVLKKYRSDLTIVSVDCPPTGLVLCSGLNANSTILQERYDQVVEEFGKQVIDETGLLQLKQLFPLVDSRKILEKPDRIQLLLHSEARADRRIYRETCSGEGGAPKKRKPFTRAVTLSIASRSNEAFDPSVHARPAYPGQDLKPLAALLDYKYLPSKLSLDLCTLDNGFVWIEPGQDGVLFANDGTPVDETV